MDPVTRFCPGINYFVSDVVVLVGVWSDLPPEDPRDPDKTKRFHALTGAELFRTDAARQAASGMLALLMKNVAVVDKPAAGALDGWPTNAASFSLSGLVSQC
jgi:hypothetical protein